MHIKFKLLINLYLLPFTFKPSLLKLWFEYGEELVNERKEHFFFHFLFSFCPSSTCFSSFMLFIIRKGFVITDLSILTANLCLLESYILDCFFLYSECFKLTLDPRMHQSVAEGLFFVFWRKEKYTPAFFRGWQFCFKIFFFVFFFFLKCL